MDTTRWERGDQDINRTFKTSDLLYPRQILAPVAVDEYIVALVDKDTTEQTSFDQHPSIYYEIVLHGDIGTNHHNAGRIDIAILPLDILNASLLKSNHDVIHQRSKWRNKNGNTLFV